MNQDFRNRDIKSGNRVPDRPDAHPSASQEVSSDEDSSENRESRTSAAAPHKKPVIAFEHLSGGGAEVLIEYQGQTYQLRTTRNGRLVLNK